MAKSKSKAAYMISAIAEQYEIHPQTLRLYEREGLLKIPQGAKNGQKFRLREKGVPNSRTGQRGDQIVEVAIQAPEPRDERTKELLREMAKLHPEDPRAEMWTKV